MLPFCGLFFFSHDSPGDAEFELSTAMSLCHNATRALDKRTRRAQQLRSMGLPAATNTQTPEAEASGGGASSLPPDPASLREMHLGLYPAKRFPFAG